MLIEPTLDRLNELGLSGMAQAFAEQLGVPDMQSISFEDRLALLLDRLVHHAHRITLKGTSMRRNKPSVPSSKSASAA